MPTQAHVHGLALPVLSALCPLLCAPSSTCVLTCRLLAELQGATWARSSNGSGEALASCPVIWAQSPHCVSSWLSHLCQVPTT